MDRINDPISTVILEGLLYNDKHEGIFLYECKEHFAYLERAKAISLHSTNNLIITFIDTPSL